MKRKELLKFVVGVSLVAVLAISIPLMSSCAPKPAVPTPAEPTPAEPTPAEPAAEVPVAHWRIASVTSVPEIERFFGPALDELTVALDGRIEFKMFPFGELMGAPEMLSAVQAGTVEMIWSAGSICAIPIDLRVISASPPLVYGSAMEFWAMWEHRGLGELFIEAYEELGDIKWITAFPGCNINIITNFPVETYEDFAKLKIRCSATGAQVIADAGGTTVEVPAGEIYLAGETGIINGVAQSAAYWYAGWAWQEVFPYLLTNPLVGETHLEFLANEDVWDALTPAQQQIITHALRSQALAYQVYNYAMEPPAQGKYFILTTLSDEDWAKVIEPQERRWVEEYAPISPRVAKAIEIIMAYHAEVEAAGWYR